MFLNDAQQPIIERLRRKSRQRTAELLVSGRLKIDSLVIREKEFGQLAAGGNEHTLLFQDSHKVAEELDVVVALRR